MRHHCAGCVLVRVQFPSLLAKKQLQGWGQGSPSITQTKRSLPGLSWPASSHLEVLGNALRRHRLGDDDQVSLHWEADEHLGRKESPGCGGVCQRAPELAGSGVHCEVDLNLAILSASTGYCSGVELPWDPTLGSTPQGLIPRGTPPLLHTWAVVFLCLAAISLILGSSSREGSSGLALETEI